MHRLFLVLALGALFPPTILLAEDSPTTYQLNRALRELALAGRALQSLAKTLEEQPEALIRGKRSGT